MFWPLGSIPIDCPIRLIHGLSDDQVPCSLALQLMENCATRDAAITLLKSSTHDMENPSDMTTMRSMILEVNSKLQFYMFNTHFSFNWKSFLAGDEQLQRRFRSSKSWVWIGWRTTEGRGCHSRTSISSLRLESKVKGNKWIKLLTFY